MSDSLFPGKNVQDYQKEIAEAQLKIRQLQDKCSHPSFEVHMYMWRPGGMYPARICTTCDALLRGITQEEIDFAWAEWKKMCEPLQYETTVQSATGTVTFNNGQVFTNGLDAKKKEENVSPSVPPDKD